MRIPRTIAGRSAFLALFGFLISTGGVAIAATASSAVATNGSYAGVNYSNQASVDNSAKRAHTAMNASSPGAPSGYMGARGRLFKDYALCQEGSNIWNSSNNTIQINGYSPYNVYCGAGSYNSYGVTYRWNGSSYNAYFTFRSPNLNF